jgi:hypothetical protein
MPAGTTLGRCLTLLLFGVFFPRFCWAEFLDSTGIGDLCDPDDDNDGRADEDDCLPFDDTNWSPPSDPLGLSLNKNGTDNLGWTVPVDSGTAGTLYYDVLTSMVPSDWSIFEAVCVSNRMTPIPWPPRAALP